MYLTATPYSKDMDINGYGYGPDVDYPEGKPWQLTTVQNVSTTEKPEGGK